MHKAEKIGLGVALAGHAVLFGLLSVGFLATPNPLKLESKPMDVSFAEDVAAEQSAPEQTDAPAISQAPETGPPEDAAPSEPASEPEPAPEPQPAPPAPAPRPQPAPRPEPKPAPKPAPAPRPVPKPVPRPAPKPAPKPEPKPAPARQQARPAPARPVAVAKAPPKAAPARPAAAPARPAAKPTATRGEGGNAQATAQRPRGGRLGNDFLKGIADTPAPGKAQAPRGTAVSTQSVAGLASAIQRQVQPCANKIPNPGPGANQIRSKVRLQMRADGTFAARPALRGQTGVDDENRRYAQRVSELAIAALIQCAPYELPADLYEGGWKDIIINYKLPG
ncbi:cell envelope biogenesis protein TolA [Sphingomonas hankookensis]|uniref:Cell envelope biogenesis protein TolA n=1 Tax=Sphingomonas hengshuiensis TaxID=1609977 RepID=A0A2W4Z5I3_9SPHN|nr:MAG: cell envelope biogenesis protein TolA [Sphingomonas hengshuiensis]